MSEALERVTKWSRLERHAVAGRRRAVELAAEEGHDNGEIGRAFDPPITRQAVRQMRQTIDRERERRE